MGCSCSKVDNQQPVALCRRRTELLAAAVRHRFTLAAAHAAYSQSLVTLSAALHRLVLASAGSCSPVLRLPSPGKSSPSPLPPPPPPPPPPSISAGHRRSFSGSHIHFPPSDDSDDEEDYCPLQYCEETTPPSFGYAGCVYYSRRQLPSSSISVEKRPSSYETVRFVSSSSFDPYSNTEFSYGQPSNDSFFSDNSGGYLRSSLSPAAMPPPELAAPPPPKVSTWDYLNPFRSDESYYSNYDDYVPSRSSKEVRDEEGIPELEKDEPEVVKEAYTDRKFTPFALASPRLVAEQHSFTEASGDQQSHYRPSRLAAGGCSSDHQPGVVDKNVMSNDAPWSLPEQRNNVAGALRFQDTSDVSGTIKEQFKRACQSAGELSALLEVGKKQYHTRHSLYEVSSRVVGAVAPPVTCKSEGYFLDFEEEKMMGVRSIASTMQKLYIWERKLYHEVKAEEKMRLLLNKTFKQLRQLDKKGEEAEKIDSMRNLIKKLSMKIRISIQVVNSISKKINKLRDEELWPQLHKLFIGLAKMLSVMLECHQIQLQAVSEVKFRDWICVDGKLTDAHASSIMQLELELLKWKENFSAWVNAQRSYSKALNGWLALCLNYEPKERADGVPPYSPGRFGAPPIFVICNCWSQAMSRISESEVVSAVDSVTVTLHHLWSQHESISPNGDLERRLKAVEKNKQVANKEVNLLNKKLALLPGQMEHSQVRQANDRHSDVAQARTLQSSLTQVFERIANFMASTVEAYEGVCKRVDKERENAEVP